MPDDVVDGQVTDQTPADPGIKVGAIAERLGVTLEGDELTGWLDQILAALPEKPASDGEDGSTSSDATEVAASTRAALGLPANATREAVTVAINTLKAGPQTVKTLSGQVQTLTDQLAERDAQDLLRPFIAKGVLRTDDKKDFEIFSKMAKSDPSTCRHLLDQRVAMLPMAGRIRAPEASVLTASSDEDAMIDASVKAHGGNYRNAIISLQKRLLDEECERTGMERKRVVAAMTQTYPKIFAA